MRRLAALMAASMVIATGAHAQWTSHASLDGTTMATVVGGRLVAGNAQALLVRDTDEGLTQTLTRINYLSQGGITAIGANGDRLVVGYTDGGIDVIDLEDRNTSTIPELRLNSWLTNKSINSVTPWGRFCYMGFSSGIIELDLRRDEIRSTWSVTSTGISVADVALTSEHIYAATASGIYRAKSDSRIQEDVSQWELMSQPKGKTIALESRGDTIFAAIGTLGSNAAIWKIVGDEAKKVATIAQFRDMSESNGQMVITRTGAVEIYGTDWELTASVSQVGEEEAEDAVVTPAFRKGCMTKHGDILIADYNAGLVVTTTSGEGHSYKPNGPRGNTHSRICAVGNVMYVAGPGRSAAYNNQGNPAAMSILRDGEWKQYTKSWSNSREPCFFASNPKDENEVYLSTWGTGVFRVEGDTLGEQYTAANTTLKDIFGGKWYTRTDAITMDKTGNLYVVACEVDSGLNIRTADGEWYAYTYGPFGGAHSYRAMMMTPNGNVWLTTSGMGGNHFTVFNINGTPETGDDDLYMSNRGVEEDPQYVGSLKLEDAETGELVSQLATAFACDANGDIWVGTQSGLLVTKDNKTMLQTGRAEFNRIKQPRNDGTNLADYLLSGVGISKICVDGANRKWISTSSEGVYLVNADGTETIIHFTASNSPLPSDEVLDMDIRQEDGEVFFVTTNGIASYHADATTPSKDFSSARIYPNPFSLSGTVDYVTIDQIPNGVTIYITDASGARVWRGESLGGTARWDGRRDDGRMASTGVYIAWMTSSDGEMDAIGKILITR
ncbi:MAG: hypothetical protein MR215_03475 [Bacteroidales bacterium]|nr:hypothetical protein [Bacteroidales bacterium]